MIDQDDLEVSNRNRELAVDLTEQVDLNQDEHTANHKPSIYLTASELMNFRQDTFKNKHKDEDTDMYKGPKLYYPSSNGSEEEKLKSILQSHKSSLELQRVAKKKDCMKAEWNDELNIAVVACLKGKTTQHMGRNFKGKIALSPEESLYLLEKNAVEIKRNNMPMSIEEAYSVILKGKLGLEKYQVYSHLSQQGFIVVQHQLRTGSKNEEVIASRKRKAVNGSIGQPEEKRTTFTGVLASNPQETVSVNINKSNISSECDNFQSSDLLNGSSHINDIAPCNEANSKSSETPSSPNQVAIPDSTNLVDSVDLVGNEKSHVSITSVEGTSEVKEAVDMRISIGDRHRSLEVSNSAEEMVKTTLTTVSVEVAGNGKSVLSEASSCTRQSDTSNKESDSHPINEVPVSQEDQALNVAEGVLVHKDVVENIDDKNEDRNEKHKSDDDTNEVIIEEMHSTERPNEINVDEDDSYSSDYMNDDYGVSDESMPVVCEESDEDLDVISCSVSDQQSSYDGFKSASSDVFGAPSEEHMDDDVTLVEVKKKENKPLAVIDLLSDEEAEPEKLNEEEQFEGSDDEIQVVKVCSGTKSNVQSRTRNSSSVKIECKSDGSVVKNAVDIKTYRPQLQFPDLFRKDVYCVSRPSVTLLPNRVRPAKELYVINRKKSQPNQGRVWESFRDLQDYQRDRRLHRQLNNSNPVRPYNSLRDYRIQRDSHSPRMNPFSHGEPSLDSNFERNNQNFSFQQNRDIFNPPISMNQRDHPSSFPLTPGSFNLPNNVPMVNMHNLPNSNPACIVNEIHRTFQSITNTIFQRTFQSLTNSFFGPHMSHLNPQLKSSPTFDVSPTASRHHFNNFTVQSPFMPELPSLTPEHNPVHFSGDPMFSGDRVPYGMNRDAQFDNNWPASNPRQRNIERKGPLFPRAYREMHKKSCWGDIKSSTEKANEKESDSSSDIEEVPINLNQFLWTNDIQPLVKPGLKLPVSEVLQKLKITQTANLIVQENINDNYLPSTSSLEISFDVYLPGFRYKKTAPQVPKLRIIVFRSIDPMPRYSEIVVLKRKFRDSAMLQMAIVDHGDISFYSFNSISLPGLIPLEN